MPQVYENGMQFDLLAGIATCVELPAPPRGMLMKLVIKQATGSLDGYTANLLNRKDACTSEAEVSSSFEPDTPEGENKLLDLELHRIIPEITVAGSSDLSEQYDLQSGYQNRDEQDIRRTPNSRIYLDINSAADGEFHVAYNVEPITAV